MSPNIIGFRSFLLCQGGDLTSLQILQDSQAAPHAFFWNGAIPRSELEQWLDSRNMDLPGDIKICLEATGGGDIFETETLLGPYARRDLGDNLEEVNHYFHSRNLPSKFIVVHKGAGGITVVDQESKKYLVLDDNNYEEHRRFNSFNDWYLGHLRSEYAKRYGLV